MKLSDTLRGLLRRWYIVFPGIILSASLAIGAFLAIPPGYERSAVQLLIPGTDSMPEGANPFLFLGGLSPAADVLVRAVGSKNVLNEVAENHPGVEIAITRDTTTAGPVILIVVTAATDAAAEEVLGLLVKRTASTLDELQVAENTPAQNRVTVLPLTVDTQSIPQQRTRLLVTAGVGVFGVLLTLLVAGLVDGVSQKRKQRAPSTATKGAPSEHQPGTLEASVTIGPVASSRERPRLPNRARYGDEPAPETQHVRGTRETV